VSGVTEQPSGHTYLDFNSPLSDTRAQDLIDTLQPLSGATVVDLGCGWAELLLRVVAADPSARGIGVDIDLAAIERGRANAESRGLGSRVRLDVDDATSWTGCADVMVCIGAGHAWNGTRKLLETAREHLRPGGRFLLGETFWERPPTPEALAALDAEPGDFGSLPDLVDLAIDCGYRMLSLSVAGTDEWDSFESRWCAGRERWLLDHPDAPDADEVRAFVDEHRNGWLRGYRGYLGFAYLTLIR
jgi:SAM-dependent methyltransferase